MLEELRAATKEFGGWEEAVAAANSHRAELDAGKTGTGSESEMTPSLTPAEPHGTTTTSYTDASTANALRKRLLAVSANSKVSTPSVELPDFPVSSETPVGTDEPLRSPNAPPSPHPLVDHPDESLSALAKEYSELESELTSSGPNYVRWPNNITLKNFAVYQLIPTLVYELEYPRTERYGHIQTLRPTG